MASGQKLTRGHTMNTRLGEAMHAPHPSGLCESPKAPTPLNNALGELSEALAELQGQSTRLRSALNDVLQPEAPQDSGAGQCGQAPTPPTSELVQTLRNQAYQIRREAMLLKNTTDRLDV